LSLDLHFSKVCAASFYRLSTPSHQEVTGRWIRGNPCARLHDVKCWLLQRCLCDVTADNHQQAAKGDEFGRLSCKWLWYNV